MNAENSKTNELQKFVLNLSQRWDLRSSNKHVYFKMDLFITRGKNKRKQYKNSKQKIITPTWNYEFELPDNSYSVPDIQDYIGYIIKIQETLTTIPAICVYINRMNNRLVFKIKGAYKLELKTLETMKLFGSTKKLKDKTKNGENRPSPQVAELVLVKCNLVDIQY